MRGLTRFRYSDATMMPADLLQLLIAECAMKFAWFAKCGYTPTYWQALFHVMRHGGELGEGLCRYRHLVAGRRGGKTMCAAFEVAFYVLHPEEFWWDYKRTKSDAPLHVWVITKDYPTGLAALTWFRKVLQDAGLTHGVEYKENRGNKWFEFENGSFVHFRSAEDPQSLRGAGNHIIWMDEAAFIPNADAWNVSRPSLSDNRGMLITTTTPDGKNWLYDYFFSGKAVDDPRHGSVEYRSIDNHHFSDEEWLELLESYHPMMFKQEYMASFDSMAGKELSGDWLKFYEDQDLDKYRENGQWVGLDLYIGVDPAISLADEADRFVISLIGVAKDRSEAFLLEQYADRIPFGTQLDVIQEWHILHRPMLIGVEGVAYQQALVQQAMRLDTFPPVVKMDAPGKKSVRILSMAPYFKIGRIRIRRDHRDFIGEWIDYDSTIRNPKDDCLDSVEIALRTAGILLAPTAHTTSEAPPQYTLDELARLRAPKPLDKDEFYGLDEHLGGDW